MPLYVSYSRSRFLTWKDGRFPVFSDSNIEKLLQDQWRLIVGEAKDSTSQKMFLKRPAACIDW